MKKISIAIPTWEYNGDGVDFLDDLLRTIQIQYFKDYEVVISDHSKDNQIFYKIKDYSSKFDIVYLKNENKRGNSSANLNNAIINCSGEIIKIMFQDDFFYDDEALDKIYYPLSDSDKMWLLNGTNHTKDGGNSFFCDMYPKFNDNLLKGVNTISSPSVVAFKRNIDIRFDENLVYFMDLDYYYGMRKKYGDPLFYNDILVSNRIHNNSISSNITHKEKIIFKESEYCINKYGVEI